MADSASSESASILFIAARAKFSAVALLRSTDSAEEGFESRGCGTRARIADIARLSGEDDLYGTSSFEDVESEFSPGYSMGRSAVMGEVGGGNIGK